MITLNGYQIISHGLLTKSATTTRDPEQHQIDACRIFLRLFWEKAERFTPSMRVASSYSFKHDVEFWLVKWVAGSVGKGSTALRDNRYISNGAMIAALITEGYVIEQSGPNAYIRGRRRKHAREGFWVLDLDALEATPLDSREGVSA